MALPPRGHGDGQGRSRVRQRGRGDVRVGRLGVGVSLPSGGEELAAVGGAAPEHLGRVDLLVVVCQCGGVLEDLEAEATRGTVSIGRGAVVVLGSGRGRRRGRRGRPGRVTVDVLQRLREMREVVETGEAGNAS